MVSRTATQGRDRTSFENRHDGLGVDGMKLVMAHWRWMGMERINLLLCCGFRTRQAPDVTVQSELSSDAKVT